MQPYQNINVLKRLGSNVGKEKRNEWIQFYLKKGFKSLEQLLRETSGKYSVGDEVTIADLALVPQVLIELNFFLIKVIMIHFLFYSGLLSLAFQYRLERISNC